MVLNVSQMAPKVTKNAPKSDQNGALGCHGAPFGDVLGQKGPRGGHKAPFVAAMAPQREPKGSPNGVQNGQKPYSKPRCVSERYSGWFWMRKVAKIGSPNHESVWPVQCLHKVSTFYKRSVFGPKYLPKSSTFGGKWDAK